MSEFFGKYENALAYEILINREYKAIDDIIFDSKIILDIGGHYWFFSSYVLLIKSGFYKQSSIENIDKLDEIINNLSIDWDFKIYFFEPIIEYFTQAKQLLSKYMDNIVFNNSWILDKAWKFDLYTTKISSQASLYKSFMNTWNEFTKCDFVNLEEYLCGSNIEKIDLLKMDIEWAEFDVLLNIDENIFNKINVIYLEYHLINPETEYKLESLLTKLKKYYYVNIIDSLYSTRLGYLKCIK